MDLPSYDTRLWLADIEAKLADQQAQNAQMLDALNNTLRLLAGMTQNQNSPLPTSQALLPVASATKPKNDLKPSPPPNFDGDRYKGKGFLNACQAYFRPGQLPGRTNKNTMGHDVHESRLSPEMG
jgi:hypothetical protein